VADGARRSGDADGESAPLRVWRLMAPDKAPGLDDRDSCLAGGRWTSEGTPALYCSSSLPLAVLEAWVHVPAGRRRAGGLPDCVAVCMELPGDAALEDVDGVGPHDGERTRAAGDAWSRAGRSLALRVPSAVVGQARNVLLNPDHPDYARLRVVSVEPCPFDPRLAEAEAEDGDGDGD
jgi:RES domain-containing protein